MTTVRILMSRVLDLFVRRRREQELTEEIQAHLDLLAEEHVRRGMSREDARSAARRAFGGVEQVKEAYRDQLGLPFADTLRQDVCVAARGLYRNAGLGVVAVLTLAIGLGMNLAVFSVVNTVLLRPFPFTAQDRLVIMWEQDLARDEHLHEVSFPNFRDWRAQSQSFEDMAAMGSTFWGHYRFVGDSDPFTGTVCAVSFSFFDTLRAKPALGRTFLPEDDAPGAPPVIVVSHRFWQTQLGGDHDAVGRSLSVADGEPITVVGVMPHEFNYPLGTDLWVPVHPTLAGIAERQEFTAVQERGLGVLFVIGRLKPGVTIEEAEPEMTGIVRQLHEEYSSDASGHRSIHILPLVEHVLGNTRPALIALWGAVSLILILVCMNVAGLLLVREVARAKEYSLRMALGAGRLRILRQMLTEVGLVAVLGAGLGLILTKACLELFVRLSPYEVPGLENATVDSEVLAFSALLIVATVALVAVAPALQFASADVATALRDAARGSTESRRGVGLRQLLVVAQITLAVVLLVGAGLMARSFLNLLDADFGFEPKNLLTFNLSLPDERYPTHQAKRPFYRDLIGRIESLPDVIATGGINPRPFLHGQIGNDWTFYVEGQTPEAREQNPRANGMVVTTNYFRAMNIQLLGGRTFTEQDDERAKPVVIISESLAQQAWAGENPVGRRLCCGWDEHGGERPWLTVIGVVENARYRDVYAPRLDLYTHFLQDWSNLSSFLVRTRSDPLLQVGGIRAQVHALDPELSVDAITTMEAVMSRVLAPWRFNMVAFVLFAVVALGLAALGLFGLLAYSVRQRTREIGIRMTLGATSNGIRNLVVKQAMGMIFVGSVIGFAGGIALTRILASLLYGASATHVTTYIAVTAILVFAALLATYFPARQAAQVDPAVSLRHE